MALMSTYLSGDVGGNLKEIQMGALLAPLHEQ
jgi:hypothetical protein